MGWGPAHFEGAWRRQPCLEKPVQVKAQYLSFQFRLEACEDQVADFTGGDKMGHISIVILSIGVMVSGCATIIKGTKEAIAVTTPPTTGAKCTLKNSEGIWYLMTPGNAMVHKTKNELHITCKKEGFEDASKIVDADFNGVTFGNAIAGGLIGVGVDAASGANYQYPQAIKVPMTPVAAATAPPPAESAPASTTEQPASPGTATSR